MPWAMLNLPWPTLLPNHWSMNLPYASRWMMRAAPMVLAGSPEIDVIGALVGMALADIDIAVRREGEHHRLPQQPLALGFVPVAAMRLRTPMVLSNFALGTELHHGAAVAHRQSRHCPPHRPPCRAPCPGGRYVVTDCAGSACGSGSNSNSCGFPRHCAERPRDCPWNPSPPRERRCDRTPPSSLTGKAEGIGKNISHVCFHCTRARAPRLAEPPCTGSQAVEWTQRGMPDFVGDRCPLGTRRHRRLWRGRHLQKPGRRTANGRSACFLHSCRCCTAGQQRRGCQ